MTNRLEIRNVSKRFSRKSGVVERGAEYIGLKAKNPVVRALDDVSLSVSQGEVVGIVGELAAESQLWVASWPVFCRHRKVQYCSGASGLTK